MERVAALTKHCADSVLLQAKEMEIYDVSAFLRSKLFATNGYKYLSGPKHIEKVFRLAGPEEF